VSGLGNVLSVAGLGIVRMRTGPGLVLIVDM
jgi:hypothetical protein